MLELRGRLHDEAAAVEKKRQAEEARRQMAAAASAAAARELAACRDEMKRCGDECAALRAAASHSSAAAPGARAACDEAMSEASSLREVTRDQANKLKATLEQRAAEAAGAAADAAVHEGQLAGHEAAVFTADRVMGASDDELERLVKYVVSKYRDLVDPKIAAALDSNASLFEVPDDIFCDVVELLSSKLPPPPPSRVGSTTGERGEGSADACMADAPALGPEPAAGGVGALAGRGGAAGVATCG